MNPTSFVPLLLSLVLWSGTLLGQQAAAPAPGADVLALKARAYQFYEARQFNAAAAQFQSYLTRQPDDVQALFDYAGLLVELNRFEEAASQLESLHQKRPQHDAAYFRLGVIYALLGRAAQAEQVFTRLQQSTNPEMAAAARQAADKLRGDQARAARFQAESRVFELARQAKHVDVLTAIDELEKQGQVSYALQLQRLYSLSALKRFGDALPRAEKLAQTHPAAPDLALVRADLLAELDRRAEAEPIWRQLVERHAGSPAAVEAARRLQERTLPPPEDRVYDLVRVRRHREALEAIAEMERQGTLVWPMELQRIYSLQALGEKPQALAKANELAARNPDSADLALLRADLLIGAREWMQAGRLLKDVQERQPGSPAARAASERLQTLPPMANLEKLFWGEAYASGDYLGRYGTVVGSGFIRQGAFIPEARWLQPYAEFRFSVDTRSGTAARETIVSDNAVGLYGGARAQLLPTEYLFVYGQAGINQDLLDRRENGDWTFDYQAGIYGFKSWGPGILFRNLAGDGSAATASARATETGAGQAWLWRGDWFVDVGADFSYYYRYRSAIGYGQLHQGFRVAQLGSKVAFDAYVVENVAWDVRGNYYDNYFDLGPGARAIWVPHPQWQVVLRAEWLAGFYFGRDELDTRGNASSHYDGAVVALSVGARW